MTSALTLLLRIARRLLRTALGRVERLLNPAIDSASSKPVYRDADTCRRYLLSLDPPDSSAERYLRFHLERLVRTAQLIPPPQSRSSVLELGCYMQLTPALQELCGYQSVRGAYLGPSGQSERKRAMIARQEVFACEIDLFDAERDRFPYTDESFELVLACELLEHLQRDPMHMLLEIRRVLEPEGILLLTTPNCAGATAVARTLLGDRNPYTFSSYPSPENEDREQAALHIREYTAAEIGELLRSAGFSVETLFTEHIPGFPETGWVNEILETHRLPTDFRGEQIYCLARKTPGAKIVRYPEFLYVG